MHPMAIFITITGAHGHFRYTLVRSYVHIFLPSTELARVMNNEKWSITIENVHLICAMLLPTLCHLFVSGSCHKAIFIEVVSEIQLDAAVEWYKRELLEHLLTNVTVYGLLFRSYIRLGMQWHTNCLPYVRKWGCRVSYNDRGIENEAYEKTTLLVVQRIDRWLVILEQGSCDKLRTRDGVERSQLTFVDVVPKS